MSNSPASNVTLTALGTEKREDPKTKTCTGRGTAKPLTEYSKGRRKRIKCKAPGVRTENFLYARNGNLKEDGRWQYFDDYQNRLTRIHEPSTGEEGPILVRCPGTTNRHRRGGPVDLSCFGRATVYVDKLLTELPTKMSDIRFLRFYFFGREVTVRRPQ